MNTENANATTLQIGEVRRRAFLTLDTKAGKLALRDVMKKQTSGRLLIATASLAAALGHFNSTHTAVAWGEEKVSDALLQQSRMASAAVLVPLLQLSKLLKLKVPGLTKKMKTDKARFDALAPGVHLASYLSGIVATVARGGQLPVTAEDPANSPLGVLVAQAITWLWEASFSLYGEAPMAAAVLAVSTLEANYGVAFFAKPPKLTPEEKEAAKAAKAADRAAKKQAAAEKKALREQAKAAKEAAKAQTPAVPVAAPVEAAPAPVEAQAAPAC